jgi:hypothetical protein
MRKRNPPDKKVKVSIKDGDPAAYSYTTPTETSSVDTLNKLFNNIFIKSDIRKQDKNPNSDGTLELTRADQVITGKLDVQVKTLKPTNYLSPKHQFSKAFLSYCYRSTLPVLLITVNSFDNKAYWLYVSDAVIEEAETRIKGNSLSIAIPPENIIDGNNEAYIQQWQQICDERWLLIKDFAEIKERNATMEKELVELRKQLIAPLALDNRQIEILQHFLDQINALLDHQFKVVKDISYPYYWKIGMAITSHDQERLSYFLLPMPYGNNDMLIKQLEVNTVKDSLTYFRSDNALVYVGEERWDNLELNAFANAKDLLKDEILRVTEKTNFPVGNRFMANEYLLSFIDSFTSLLDFTPNLIRYDLNELNLLVSTILPVAFESQYQYIAPGVKQVSYSIDQDRFRQVLPHYLKNIETARKKLAEGFQLDVEVYIYSKIYTIRLLQYYIHYLQSSGFDYAERVYRMNQTSQPKNPLVPAGWNKVILVENLKIFFVEFFKVYQDYLNGNFPYLEKEFRFFAENEMIIFSLVDLPGPGQKPSIEIYRMKGDPTEVSSAHFFTTDDPENPVDRKKWFIDREEKIIFQGKSYQIVSVHTLMVDFMFDPLPTYSLIHHFLNKPIQRYFDERKRKR